MTLGIRRAFRKRTETEESRSGLAGVRRKRRDSTVKRVSSRIANAIRRRVLRDATTDTGCGLKLFQRDAYLALPFFDHMHRFLPALIRRAGGAVLEIPVNHRPRAAGASHYGMWDRAWVGLIDMLGVALLAYAIYKEDPVFIVGQGAGLLIYTRILYFIRRAARAETDGKD